ncbi:trypsin-like cysteine/serine peptidase domain-containing protein [Dipodascopsis tothii]|uniref:trypsin-like cysteine/serine peptidase domain-containing protein n=1 Tax=Dipodascopsis tothii TaxID=44089 RepID=UPI0034CDAE59
MVATRSGRDSIEWEETIKRVVNSVVSIQFTQPMAFEFDLPYYAAATGFVVDAERGLIMTNRHVVGAGPFTGYAIFNNHEECELRPVYRDPVHDFGIVQFDPKAIKYMPVVALELRPDLAKVGAEIKVVGNDAGEKLSILTGLISRIDRNVPDYGLMTYNDSNTEYIQASASTTGGSSGSPVINIDGYAIALQAGGRTDASTGYFLPLYRGLRALRCIQNGQPITRGTIQVQWLLKPYDECRRFDLSPESEKMMRTKFPQSIGMLVAESVLPEGPADGKIKEGDCLLSVEDEFIGTFVRLDEILDNKVGETVRLALQRSGETLHVDIAVDDFHKLLPDRFVLVSGSAFSDMSYQAASQYSVPVRGVCLPTPGGAFGIDQERMVIIESLDHKPTADLDSFVEVVKTLHDRQWVVMTYRLLRDMNMLQMTLLYFDRHWMSEFSMVTRNDDTGLWDFKQLGEALPPLPPTRQTAEFTELHNPSIADAGKLVRSFVKVTCFSPIRFDGFPFSRSCDSGLVVDAEQGLVLVSRRLVPYDMCDVIVTVAESINVEAKVVFLHPLHNWALVQYDPALVDAPIETAVLSMDMPVKGSDTMFLGFNHNMRTISVKTSITDVSTVSIPNNPGCPRYHTVSLDAVTVDSTVASQCNFGVLAKPDGTVEGVWLNFLGEYDTRQRYDVEYTMGMPSAQIAPIVAQIRAGRVPSMRILDVVTVSTQIVYARSLGVSEERIRRVEETNKDIHQLFRVKKLTCQLDGRKHDLQDGDIVLSIKDKPVTVVSAINTTFEEEELDMVVVRGRQELRLQVKTLPTHDIETTRLRTLPSLIYIGSNLLGSPASQFGLMPTYFVTHTNGRETRDLDAFLDVVKGLKDKSYVKLNVTSSDFVPVAFTIKLNLHYFPTLEMVKDPAKPGVWHEYTYVDGVRETGGRRRNVLDPSGQCPSGMDASSP